MAMKYTGLLSRISLFPDLKIKITEILDNQKSNKQNIFIAIYNFLTLQNLFLKLIVFLKA